MNAHCIDACSAPGYREISKNKIVSCLGNKTSHLAAILSGTGQVDAFEANGTRLKMLKNNMSLFGASNVRCALQDFLSVDPLDSRYRC